MEWDAPWSLTCGHDIICHRFAPTQWHYYLHRGKARPLPRHLQEESLWCLWLWYWSWGKDRKVLVCYSRMSVLENEEPRFSKVIPYMMLLIESLGIWAGICRHEIIGSSLKPWWPFQSKARYFHKSVCTPEPSARHSLESLHGWGWMGPLEVT